MWGEWVECVARLSVRDTVFPWNHWLPFFVSMDAAFSDWHVAICMGTKLLNGAPSHPDVCKLKHRLASGEQSHLELIL